MAELSREELKKRFRNGSLAREENFVDLIDSFVNKTNDNLRVAPEGGLGLTPDNKRFISFYSNGQDTRDPKPLFSFESLDNNQNSSGIAMCIPGAVNGNKNLMSFTSQRQPGGTTKGRVGINTSSPVADLDVNGAVGMKSRTGTFSDPAIDPKQIVADGKWHKVLTNLNGITAIEILTVAYCPKGKHAVYYSVLTNAFGKSKSVTALSQSYSSWWHRIRMRWTKSKRGFYGLEVRTACSYKTRPVIINRITKLWI